MTVTWLVLATLVSGGGLVASLMTLVISPMMLTGDGGPSAGQWLAVGALWTAPLAFLVAIIGQWVAFAMGAGRVAVGLSLVPAPWWVLLGVAVLLTMR